MCDFCLLDSLRGRGRLRRDGEERDKWGRAARTARGLALGAGGGDRQRGGVWGGVGGCLRLETFAVLSQILKGSSLLINF